MTNFIKTQSSFANGEVAPEFYAKDNVNGLAKLENMDVISGGGLIRRPGLMRIATLPENARLIPFSVSEDENYVLVFMDNVLRIFLNDEFVQDINVPWTYSDAINIQYAQHQGTIIFVHPDFCPKKLFKDNGVFKIRDFVFFSSDGENNIDIPFMRFDDSKNINITVTYEQNAIVFTTNEDFWTQDNVNGYLSLLGKTWLITSYVDSKSVTAMCNGQYTLPQAPVSDWKEAAFSKRRGWPRSVTFHQDRLVFGGTSSCPGGVWLSRVGQYANFNLGTGLDDEAIYFSLLSGHRQHICTMVSSNNLQILTSQGEWAVSNAPLTPMSVDIKMHTNIGCVSDRSLPPQEIEGTTVFVSNDKHQIRELVLDQVDENYKANNLCPMSNHLIDNPTDISYNKKTKKLFVVLENGDMAVMNIDTALEIFAWGRYTTNGKFMSVMSIGGDTFVIVQREENIYMEKFSESVFNDSGDYSYSVYASGLPLRSAGHNTKLARIRKITTRVIDTKTLQINNEPVVFPNEIYDEHHQGFTGDVSKTFLGTTRNFTDFPWSISSSDSLPLKILSVTIYGQYQI